MLNINIHFVTDEKFVFIEIQIIESIRLLLLYSTTRSACSVLVAMSGIQYTASLAL